MPEPPTMRSKTITEEEATAEFVAALRMVAEDLAMCLADDARVRQMYEALVTVCTGPPVVVPVEDEHHD